MMTEDDSEMKWRDLALQFDGHRMQAISFLKMILSDLPDSQYASARDFIKSVPLSGEEVLRSRIAALTQPARPALKLPDEMAIDGRHLRGDSIHNVFARGEQSGFNRCLDEVKRLNAPHTAPIEPICATGGAEWVKVSERLPKQHQSNRYVPLNLLLNERTVAQGGFDDGEFWVEGVVVNNVTHWMPLPAAPEEK